jgi:hypothetical protein
LFIAEVERLRWRIWNGKAKNAQRSIVTPASARIERNPEQPSVNAVTAVSAVRPTL